MFPVVLMKNNLQICRFSNLQTITAKFFLTFAVLTITQQMFAQFTDDFSDGDFTDSPAWSGMVTKFTIAAQELKLQADPATDIAYLTIATSSVQDSWEFLVRLEFNPSATNYTRIYLASDQSELSGPLNGYFVLMGNTTDDVSLYKQTAAATTKLIDGVDGRLDLSTVSIKVKVTRDDLGHWELFTDVGASGTYLSEGTTLDATYPSPQYFGVLCGYTATRSDKFYFDDFKVTGNSLSDTFPPELYSVNVISSTELLLTFSENIDRIGAETIVNYNVDANIGNPTTAILQENKKTVALLFDKSFSNNQNYNIDVSGIKDSAGNGMDLTTRNFLFFLSVPANYKDIVFTEIFADPSPKIGLPELEFVEIFNRSENPFDLQGWQLMDEATPVTLPSLVLLPDEYLILTSSAIDFNGYGKVWGSPDFPSLNNGGDMLLLKNSDGATVDSVNFTDRWYKDDERKNGGWSLELIDPENLCSESENWVASQDPYGGTPGKQNSVLANKPDLKGPAILSAIPISPTLLRLTFNEKLEKSLPSKNGFGIVPSIEINGISFSDLSLKSLQISLSSELQPGVSYSITANTVYDCSGNSIDPDFSKIVFGLPESANGADIVINEILFNPRSTGIDFVEIVNTSLKFINLKNWQVANIELGVPENKKAVTQDDFLLNPGAYLVLTENLDVLKGEYPILHEENILILDDLPGFNDDEGTVAFVDDHDKVIDYFLYTDDLHSPFIKDEEGVSLERISFSRPSNESQNWKSASSLAGYATPGYVNSNALAEPEFSEGSIKIEPEVFIPVTGQPDFTQIHYKFDHGGYVANIKIYDEQGHLIKRIANNELLGTEGTLRWDGDRDDGSKIRMGYYMIWFELFDSSGEVITFRKPVAVAARF